MHQTEFMLRRRQLMQQMGANSIAILFAASECLRCGDDMYPYRQDSDFYYLTGFDEPESVAVLVPNNGGKEFILFNRERNPAKELWTGNYAGQDGACKEYGADAAFPISSLDAMIPELLSGKEKIYFKFGTHTLADAKVAQWMNQLKAGVRNGIQVPTAIIDLNNCLHEMRLRKSEAELTVLRSVAEISAKAHLCAMQACAPGKYEYELEAELSYGFMCHGCRYTAFSSIVGGGRNSCVLHYAKNNEILTDGELVLLDAGAEQEYYSADITRTYPVNGKFTQEQRLIYQVVLDAQLAVISIIKPGVKWNILQETAERVITERLVALGILYGDVNQLLVTQAFKPFFMHKIGHWLGLDCHDVGAYKPNNEWRVLEPNMVLTVEPGIYISAANKDVATKWWNIGVRIEDTVVVTSDGCEVLTASVPKTINEIEAVMQCK